MESLKTFFNSSTIHGLSYISETKKFVRLFWTLIVIGGFVTAGILIYQSFQSWAESPVTTTIETLPISEITFPKVTVCPPKNTFTNLNYDLEMLGNKTIDDDARDKLIQVLFDEIHDPHFKSMMKNLSLFQEENRFYNWYHGYTEIVCPYMRKYTVPSLVYPKISENSLFFDFFTTVPSGYFETPNFGSDFNESKFIKIYESRVTIYVPNAVANNNFTLFLSRNYTDGSKQFTTEVKNVSKNAMRKSGSQYLHCENFVTYSNGSQYETTPGFRVDWNYDINVPVVDRYSEFPITQLYIR